MFQDTATKVRRRGTIDFGISDETLFNLSLEMPSRVVSHRMFSFSGMDLGSFPLLVDFPASTGVELEAARNRPMAGWVEVVIDRHDDVWKEAFDYPQGVFSTACLKLGDAKIYEAKASTAKWQTLGFGVGAVVLFVLSLMSVSGINRSVVRFCIILAVPVGYLLVKYGNKLW